MDTPDQTIDYTEESINGCLFVDTEQGKTNDP